MTRPGLGLGFALWVGVAAAGCTPSNKVKPGEPVMVSFGVVGPDGAPVELETEAGRNPAPPLSKFFAVFDRLLDPAGIETLVDGSAEPNNGVATVTADGAEVASTVLYVPNGDAEFTLVYPPGPSITITPKMGLPSGAMVTVSLSADHVRSHDRTKPFKAGDNVPETLSFETEALAATIDVPQPPEGGGATDPDAGADADGGVAADGGAGPAPAPPVDPTFVANVTFNNNTADDTGATISASATVGGVAVAALGAVVARAPDSANVWTVSPPADGWPAGAVVTVTVGASAADLFGKTLGTAVTATFTVKS